MFGDLGWKRGSIEAVRGVPPLPHQFNRRGGKLELWWIFIIFIIHSGIGSEFIIARREEETDTVTPID